MNKELKTISILGANRITPIKGIASVLKEDGIEAIFYEQKSNVYFDLDGMNLSICSENAEFPQTPFIIFSEYWLSKLIEQDKNVFQRHKDLFFQSAPALPLLFFLPPVYETYRFLLSAFESSQ